MACVKSAKRLEMANKKCNLKILCVILVIAFIVVSTLFLCVFQFMQDSIHEFIVNKDESSTSSLGHSALACKNDEHESCEVRASKGECCSNPSYMLSNCAKSCGQCGGDSSPDLCEIYDL